MPNILIIDDDKMVCEATRILLQSRGYGVTVALDGKSGIEAIRAGGIDLAIVDLFMPNIDGLKVMQAIRHSNPNLPMIAASGFMFDGQCPQMPGFDAMANAAGAAFTLYKPFRPQEILRVVEQALGASAYQAS